MENLTAESRPIRWPWLAAAEEAGQIWLYDPRRIGGPPRVVTQAEFEALQRFTGRWSLAEIHSQLVGSYGGTLADRIAFANRLDESHFLNSDRFRAYLRGQIRRPVCLGTYPAEPHAIRAQTRQLFEGPYGPGGPGGPRTDGPRLRAVLVPHMDYARGNVTYGWGFKELAERTDARLFVIIATSHYSAARFTLTRMNFQTPLGIAQTDQAYIDRIVEQYGDGLFEDPFAHLPEHSIELEVLILQQLFPEQPLRIVPLLVGSFGDCVTSGRSPLETESIARMVAALRHAEATAGEPVCYVISGDLAHIGPKFGDDEPAAGEMLETSALQDRVILDRLAAADPEGYFRFMASENDTRRICGFPPTYLTLAVTRPSSGRVLHYQQFVHPQGHESVSFAAASFYA